MDTQILEYLKARGPVTVKNISRHTGFPKTLIRGVLWHSPNTRLEWRAPVCTRKKPVWSYSETRERPNAHKVAHLVLRPPLKEHEDEDHEGETA